MENNLTMIHTVAFSELNVWDVKTFFHLTDIFNKKYPVVLFGEFLKKPQIDKVQIKDSEEYKILGARAYGKGAFVNRIVKGKTLKMRTYQQAKVNHLFWCKVDTKNGAFGIITEDLADGVGSSNMTFAKIDITKANPEFVQLLFGSKKINEYMDGYVSGTTNRKYIKPDQLRDEIKIVLPPISVQNRLVDNYNKKICLALDQENKVTALEQEKERFLFEMLGIQKQENKKAINGLRLTSFFKLVDWSSGFNVLTDFESALYQNISINMNEALVLEVFRGKSPKYDKNGNSLILNQKCNRWNYIEIEHAKTVNDNWYKKIDPKFFTNKGDVIINSTGEGTIGRATFINENFEKLLYDSHMLLVRFNKEIVDPLFFTLLFNSSYGQNQVNSIKSAQSTKQTELGVNNLKKIIFPLPPLRIQNEISNKLIVIDKEIISLKYEAEHNRTTAIKDFEQEIFKS